MSYGVHSVTHGLKKVFVLLQFVLHGIQLLFFCDYCNLSPENNWNRLLHNPPPQPARILCHIVTLFLRYWVPCGLYCLVSCLCTFIPIRQAYRNNSFSYLITKCMHCVDKLQCTVSHFRLTRVSGILNKANFEPAYNFFLCLTNDFPSPYISSFICS